jgi:hypothetical protein
MDAAVISMLVMFICAARALNHYGYSTKLEPWEQLEGTSNWTGSCNLTFKNDEPSGMFLLRYAFT